MKRLFPFLTLILLVAPLSAENTQPGALRSDAVNLYHQGRFEEAARIYQRLTSIEPNNVGLQKDYMWTLWNAARYEEAAAIATSLSDKNPDDLEVTNLLARAQMRIGQKDAAMENYKKSLEMRPDQSHVRRALGNMFVDLRDFETAISYLEEAMRAHPEKPETYPQLAKAHFYYGNFARSLGFWRKAVTLYPENIDYKFNLGRALYYSGHIDEALELFKSLSVDPSAYYWRSVDFLVDDALAMNNHAVAQHYLEQHLTELRPQDEPRYIKLADIYRLQGHNDKALRLLNRVLNVSPANGSALLFKAEFLAELGRYEEAKRFFKRVIELNPWSIRAFQGMAEIAIIERRPTDAIKVIEKARRLDPTSPYLLIRHAHYLYEAGYRTQSRRLLQGWLKDNADPVVPILLYHGLTPFSRDPILAYSVHMTTTAFDAQIGALKTAGYEPITVVELLAWYQGKGALPKRPVMIAFDDARLDSFKHGDPILKKYGFKATMFASLANVEGSHPPAYAPWQLMQRYAHTGRWEIQAHGDLAHVHIPTDESGHQGLFLVNRMWLEKEKRLETLDEWTDRIANDHASCRRKIARHMGEEPVGYALPEGTYGQDNVNNDPNAGEVNLKVLRAAYPIAFTQDSYGINTKSRDLVHIARVEPKPNWGDTELLRHLRDVDPFTQVYRRMLRLAAWDERISEAYEWLAKIKGRQASQPILFGEEARIRLASQDVEGARELAQRAYDLDPNPDNTNLLRSIELEERAVWRPEGFFAKDNRDRENWTVGQTLQLSPVGRTRFSLSQWHSSLRQRGTPTITDNAVGASLAVRMNANHALTLHGLGHFFTHHADNAWDGRLQVESRWTPELVTEVEGGRQTMGTAPAITHNTIERYGRLSIGWPQDGMWRVVTRAKYADLSDDNERVTGQLNVSRSLSEVSKWRVVYRFMYDDTTAVSPDYYSPQEFVANQLGVEYATDRLQKFGLYVRYLPGIGTEKHTKSEFIQDLEAGLPIRVNDRLSLGPNVSLVRTATYRRNAYGFFLSCRL